MHATHTVAVKRNKKTSLSGFDITATGMGVNMISDNN